MSLKLPDMRSSIIYHSYNTAATLETKFKLAVHCGHNSAIYSCIAIV